MSDIGKRRAEQEAWRHVGAVHASRYGDAVKRYLAATGDAPAAGSRASVASKAEPVTATGTRPGIVAVGVDETLTSYTAVDHAAIEAELHGWDLRLLHVRQAGESVRPVTMPPYG